METYFLGAYWGSRRQSVEECADRVMVCLQGLAGCDEAFSRWFRGGRSRKEALKRRVSVTPQTLKELLLRGRYRKDVGREVIPDMGFLISLWNGGADCQSVGLMINCGAYPSNPQLGNFCRISLPSEGAPRERLLTIERLLCALRAVVESWEPDWATVMPDALLETVKIGPKQPAVGWLFYAKGRVLPSARMPESARVVDIPDRGRIIIVTEERFDSQKPEHLRARDAVQAAIGSTLQL